VLVVHPVEGPDHADAGEVLAHHPVQGIELGLYGLEERHALACKATMARAMTGRTTSSIQDSLGSVDSAMMMPPTAIIGACAIMRCIMNTTCWTWVMSLVVR
jgi:hypothetical protein